MALAATLFFAVRIVIFTIYWSDPAHQDQVVQGWMTPGYVANSWDIPRSELQTALGELARPGERKSLQQLAEEGGVPLSDLLERVEAAIASHRARQ